MTVKGQEQCHSLTLAKGHLDFTPIWEKVFFSETTPAYDFKVGRCIQLNK